MAARRRIALSAGGPDWSKVRRWFGWVDLAVVPMLFGIGTMIWRWSVGQSLWLDEEMIARNIRDRDFRQLAGTLDHNQSAPLGWLWAQRGIVRICGTDERALRLVPLLFGIGTLLAAWLIARRLFGTVGTCAVVSFLAVNHSILRYAEQVKQYTSDVFWVLLLLGLAIRCLRAPDHPRRSLLFWSSAAIACVFSTGAILATPCIGLILVAAGAGRGRWRPALRTALPGLIWLIAVAVHYWFALRFALGNETLADYWAGGYPERDAGAARTVDWYQNRLDALALDPLSLDPPSLEPGRTAGPWFFFVSDVFWALVLIGVLVAAYRHRWAGGLLVAPVLGGAVLAWLRMVPLTGRMAMWLIPPLVLAFGYAVDGLARAVRLGSLARIARFHGLAQAVRLVGPGEGRRRRPIRWSAGARTTIPRWLPAAGAAVVGATALHAFAPLVPATLDWRPQPRILTDRASVGWLVDERRPGDVVLVLDGNQHAVEWYAPDGRLGPYQLVTAGGARCLPGALDKALAGHRRALIFGALARTGAEDAAESLTSYFTTAGLTVHEVTPSTRVMWRVVELGPLPAGPAGTSPCLRPH